MSQLVEYFGAFTWATEFSWIDAFDMLLVIFLIYKLLELIRGSRALQMAVGTLMVVILFFVSRWARLDTVDWL